jgi:predicted phosphodiesterase
VQRFSAARDKTRDALAEMRSEHCDVVLQLGDIIQSDETQPTHEIAADLDTMCRVFHESEAPVLHTIGNHCIPWNGGCTQRQLDWLKDELKKAMKRHHLVVIASHHPVQPAAARRTHLAWNYQDILNIVRACPAVRLVVSGHDHVGGACRQSSGGGHQLYLTMPAILEASVDSTEYLVLNLGELERCTDEREIPSDTVRLTLGEETQASLLVDGITSSLG